MKYIVELEPGLYLGCKSSKVFETNSMLEAYGSTMRKRAVIRLKKYRIATGKEFPQAQVIASNNCSKAQERVNSTKLPGIPEITDNQLVERINNGVHTYEDELRFTKEAYKIGAKIQEMRLKELEGQVTHTKSDGRKVSPIRHTNGRVVRKPINVY